MMEDVRDAAAPWCIYVAPSNPILEAAPEVEPLYDIAPLITMASENPNLIWIVGVWAVLIIVVLIATVR